MTKEELEPLLDKKLSAAKIAAELQTSETNVRYWCKKLGLPLKCGRRIIYQDNDIKTAVLNSTSYNGVLRQLGIKTAGGAHANIKKRILDMRLDTSHFTSKTNRLTFLNKKTANEILVKGRRYREEASRLRRALLEIGREYSCVNCGNIGEWLGKPITLQVDHIDGDWSNNECENLRFLCPNCHNQTDNFGAKKFRKRCITCDIPIGSKSKWCRNHCEPRRIRKVEQRPTIEVLQQDVEELGFVGAGRKYGVSDNTIRKWIK